MIIALIYLVSFGLILFSIINFITAYRSFIMVKKPLKRGHVWKETCVLEFQCKECGVKVCWSYNYSKYTKARPYNIGHLWLVPTGFDYGTCDEEKMHDALG